MREKYIMKEIVEWSYCIIIAIVLALAIRYFVGTPTIVKQPSMYPTLQQDQRLWLNRINRTTHKLPERGQIITFEAPSVTFLSEGEYDRDNAIAIYDNQPTNVFSKFTYNVLEIGKVSYIKRVIALPGEHVQIQNGKVYINSQLLQEDYLQPGVVTDISKAVLDDIVVPENCVFAMGDNRPNSTDCRAFGCVPLDKIESTVSFRFWPLNLFGAVE